MGFHEIACGVALAVGATACSVKPPPLYKVVIKVQGDPNQAISGAKVLYNGRQIGKTDAEGKALLGLKGEEGQDYSFTVTCPEGFLSPKDPISVALHRTTTPSKRPEYLVNCPPTTRKIVVAVRAENGPNLPIMYLNTQIGRTDSSGAAHVLLKLPPNEPFKLMLDTKDASRLRPKDPVMSFEVKDRDDIFVFDQAFKVKAVHHYYRRVQVGPKPL